MRDGEGLVKVKMSYISTDRSWRCESKLGIEIGSVHVDLSTMLVHDITNFLDVSVENSKSRWVGDHDTRQLVFKFLAFLSDIVDTDLSVVSHLNWDNLHSTDNS